MSLAAKLKQLRNAKGWTQGQLALYSGLDRGYISQLETDRIKNPSADTFVKLAKALQVYEGELMLAAGLQTKGYVESPTEGKTPEQERLDMLKVIYDSQFLSSEDKEYFTQIVERTFDSIEYRKQAKEGSRGVPGSTPTT